MNILKKIKLNEYISTTYSFVINRVDSIITLLMCLALGIICISKGGFYKEDILFPTMLICIFSVIFIFSRLVINVTDSTKTKKSWWVLILDTFVTLLPVAYVLPIIFKKAVSIESSCFEALRYVNFAIIYFVVRTTKYTSRFRTMIIISAVVTGIFGIDEVTYRALESLLYFVNAKYITNVTGVLSSFIQYANVTAIIALFGSVLASYNIIEEKKGSSLKALFHKSLYLYICMFLQICVILTESRMNFAMLVCMNIILGVYFFTRKRYKSLVAIIFPLIISIICSGIIDFCVEIQMFGMVYIVLCVLWALCIIVPYLAKKVLCKGIRKMAALFKLPSAIKWILLIAVGVCAIIALMTDTPLTVSTKDGYNSTVRYLYDILKGQTNTVYISYEYEIYTPEAKCDLLLNSINENNYGQTIWKQNIIDGKQVGQIQIELDLDENAKVLELDIQATDAKVIITEIKLNGKKCVLSYKYLPDELMFRLKNTGFFDVGNEARFVYYEDALKLIKMSPVIGQGGEAFLTRYQEIQTYPYVSSEVHSFVLQLIVETGYVGGIILVAIAACTIIIAVCCIINFIKRLKHENKGSMTYIAIDNKLNLLIYILLLFIALIIISTFDLIFSFGIVICLLAIILGSISNMYVSECNKDIKFGYTLDSKSGAGLVKTVILTVLFIILLLVTIYSVKIYKASIVKVELETYDVNKSDVENSNIVLKRIVAINKKCKLDEYNLDYLTALSDEYSAYLNVLRSMYLNVEAKYKEELDNHITNATIAQKEVVDKIIECEYYNKYALYEVANCYFSNYLYYAEIYQDNFESADVAYAFYLNYAFNLTKRIKQIAPQNDVANTMYVSIHEKYIEQIERQQVYLKSNAVQMILEQMKQNMKEGT